VASYNAKKLSEMIRSAKGAEERAVAELAATKTFLKLARHMGSGVLEPRRVDSEIHVFPKRRDEMALLAGFAGTRSYKKFFDALAPRSSRYSSLMSEKTRLEGIIADGGWGAKVPGGKTLRPGLSSKRVQALQARLSRMGYGNMKATGAYDETVVGAVKRFQTNHGLNADGVAGPATVSAINTSAAQRLQQVIVNLERLRWLNFDPGSRHIYVNLADYSASLMDNGKATLKTRVVIGKSEKDRTPEFSDSMTHLVVNPTWHVPRSIAGKEYLPIIRKDPGFLKRKNMRMVNSKGKRVNPSKVNLSKYNERNFPFYIKQAPNPGNALGRVKFMFPNQFNIYLHDTPSKSLFNKDRRAFSHGCVRVQKPFELAYALLAPQMKNAKGSFQAWLKTGKERYVNFKAPVPVHLAYHSAWVDDAGNTQFRADVYGRDKKVFRALQNAGVSAAGA
jgi:murein L,D-transpeptidase YcbB/YkuD